MGPTYDDPLHGMTSSARFWTTVNASEGLPGVPSPMTWTWYDEGTEPALLAGLAQLGARSPRRITPSLNRDERHFGIVHGHAVLNVDLWRLWADALPGTSGSAFERDILGSERADVTGRALVERYPFVAIKAPLAIRRAAHRLRRGRDTSNQWWWTAIAAAQHVDETRARELFDRAFRRYTDMATTHFVATMAAQGLYDGITRLCRRLNLAGYERRLSAGLGTEESAIVEALWRVAHNESATIDDVVRAFGYQGPNCGEIAQHSWRERPEMLSSIINQYRSLPDEQSPAATARRQRTDRADAQGELLGRLPRSARTPARVLLHLLSIYVPLRETGRAELLRAVDAGRAAARAYAIGALGRGSLLQADDVFMLTVGEMNGSVPAPGPDELSFRRTRREHYRTLEIPSVFQGVAAPIALDAEPAAETEVLTGVGVSDGVVEGIARVIRSPDDYDSLEPGDILVCHTTDPSWASLFVLASAVVVDIGGPMSHGAIVARELGLPCVSNTKHGTRSLRSGQRIRVDGHAGTVRRLN